MSHRGSVYVGLLGEKHFQIDFIMRENFLLNDGFDWSSKSVVKCVRDFN